MNILDVPMNNSLFSLVKFTRKLIIRVNWKTKTFFFKKCFFKKAKF